MQEYFGWVVPRLGLIGATSLKHYSQFQQIFHDIRANNSAMVCFWVHVYKTLFTVSNFRVSSAARFCTLIGDYKETKNGYNWKTVRFWTHVYSFFFCLFYTLEYVKTYVDIFFGTPCRSQYFQLTTTFPFTFRILIYCFNF